MHTTPPGPHYKPTTSRQTAPQHTPPSQPPPRSPSASSNSVHPSRNSSITSSISPSRSLNVLHTPALPPPLHATYTPPDNDYEEDSNDAEEHGLSGRCWESQVLFLYGWGGGVDPRVGGGSRGREKVRDKGCKGCVVGLG